MITDEISFYNAQYQAAHYYNAGITLTDINVSGPGTDS